VSSRSILALLLASIVALAGCAAETTEQPEPAQPESAQPVAKHEPAAKSKPKAQAARKRRRRIGTAAYMLRRLKVRAAAGSASYDRERFGGWRTRDGCTTRERVLIKESRRGREAGCHVRRGFWLSVYDGERTRDPSDFDIDHLVPLGEAWVSGARRWTPGTSERYTNDLGYSGTLRAVSAGSNRAKGDQDPASWMPPRAIHHCKYIGTWIAVKYRWRLTIDRAERAVLWRYVDRCARKSDVPIPDRARVRYS
jgi:hypothetical protein